MSNLPVPSKSLMYCKFTGVSNVPSGTFGDSLHHKHTHFQNKIWANPPTYIPLSCLRKPACARLYIYFLVNFHVFFPPHSPAFQAVKIIQSLGLELCSIRYPFQLCHSQTWKRVFLQKADKMLTFIQALGPMAGSLPVCNGMIKTW